MNYLRQLKSEEMSGIETTVSSLQKRYVGWVWLVGGVREINSGQEV